MRMLEVMSYLFLGFVGGYLTAAVVVARYWMP